jgi:hypothetical protein
MTFGIKYHISKRPSSPLVLAASLPRVRVLLAAAEPAGPGLWRVVLHAANEGFLPTRIQGCCCCCR